MEVINGTDIVIVVETSSGNYKPIAGAKSFTLTVNRTIRDTSHKHVGDAARSDYGRYNWSVSIEALRSFYGDYVNEDWFLNKILTKAKVKFFCGLLDYETADKAPLTQSTAIQIQDAGDTGIIDDDTTAVSVQDDHFALNSVIAELTPKAKYGQAVIESWDVTAGDDDNPTFSVNCKGDKSFRMFTISPTSGVTYGAMWQAVYNALNTKYGTADAAAANTLCETMVTNNWDDEIDFIYDLSADHASDTTLNWITALRDATANGTITLDPGVGSTSNGSTGYINSGFNFGDGGTYNYTQNDAFVLLVIQDNLQENNVEFGTVGAGDCYLQVYNTSDMAVGRINDDSNLSGSNTNSIGIWIMSRDGTTKTITKSGNSVATTALSSTGVENADFYIFGWNNSGIGSITNKKLSMIIAGAASNINMSNLVTAVEAYLDAKSIGVIT